VILAGFDCYGGTRAGQHREYLPHIKCEVRAVSGPLLELWPQYDPAEQMKPYEAPDVFVAAHGVTVRVMKPVEIRGQKWPVGTVLQVPRQEVWRQLKHRSLAEVST
jgi:hypothetical protein